MKERERSMHQVPDERKRQEHALNSSRPMTHTTKREKEGEVAYVLLHIMIITEAGPLEKPEIIKTHLRDLVITPELIGSIVAIYNGKVGEVAR